MTSCCGASAAPASVGPIPIDPSGTGGSPYGTAKFPGGDPLRETDAASPPLSESLFVVTTLPPHAAAVTESAPARKA